MRGGGEPTNREIELRTGTGKYYKDIYTESARIRDLGKYIPLDRRDSGDPKNPKDPKIPKILKIPKSIQIKSHFAGMA